MPPIADNIVKGTPTSYEAFSPMCTDSEEEQNCEGMICVTSQNG